MKHRGNRHLIIKVNRNPDIPIIPLSINGLKTEIKRDIIRNWQQLQAKLIRSLLFLTYLYVICKD